MKRLEKKLGHDVVALTTFIQKKLDELGYTGLKPFVHFGLTSEDVNNIAYAVLIKSFIQESFLPELTRLVEKLLSLAEVHGSTVFLARTHGQPAVPTTFGSYIANYAYRLAQQAVKLKQLKLQAKIGGAVGDLSSLKTSYPELDWDSFAERFITSLGLEYNPAATQVLPHERMSEILQTISLTGVITANLCRDMWLLGSLGLVGFTKPVEAVHSSTMPQKRNPLLFENAEGCLDLSTAIFNYMSTRLISSRLHRDLSDSVIKRFYGLALSLTLLGLKNTSKALDNLYVNADAMRKELDNNPQALLEAIQLTLRKQGVEEGYRLAAEAAEKGLTWLNEKLEHKNIKPPINSQEIINSYIKVAHEKALKLSTKTRQLIGGLT